MSKPAISVIVPHYDDLLGLDRCLQALEKQDTERSFEIIVSDNASPQGEASVRDVIGGRARLVLNLDRGAGPTRNAGVAVARGAILAFTDSDCVPEVSWLAAGTAALDRFDIVGGRMIVLAPEARARSGPEAFEHVFAFDNAAYIRDKGFSVTANLFCSRHVFEATGGFRTQVSEDLEWCHRARARGFTLGFAADALVGHPPRPDWAALRTKWRRINSESYALQAGTAAGRLNWLIRTWLLPVSIIAHMPRLLSDRSLSRTERAAAFVTLARLRLWRFADAHRLLFSRGR